MAIRNTHLTQPRDLILVWPKDPSVLPDSDILAYQRTGEVAHLVLDGRETRFHCRLIGGDEWKQLMLRCSAYQGSESRLRAFAEYALSACVSRISQWEHEDGTIGDLPREEWSRQLNDDLRQYIGGLIVTLSRAPGREQPAAEEAASDVPLSQPPASSTTTAPSTG